LISCNDSLFADISGAGGGDASAPSKILTLVKIRTKFLKIGKIRGNLEKICENLGKLPENTSKNGVQRALFFFKIGLNVCRIT